MIMIMTHTAEVIQQVSVNLALWTWVGGGGVMTP